MSLRKLSIISFVFFLCIGQTSARDFEGAYAVYGAGAESCKNFNLAMKRSGAAQSYYDDWLIGYLSAFNVIMPETHNILGEMDFASAQGWLQRNCNRYPNELFVNAAARLTEVLYPMRYKSGLKDSAQAAKTPPPLKTKKKLSDIKIR